MNITNSIILLTSLCFMTACASKVPQVTGTEGIKLPGLSNSNTTADGSLDSDGDSIPDSLDNCAGTPSSAMTDSEGCEIVMGAIEGLNFGINEVSLPDNAGLVLDPYVEALKRNTKLSVSIEAHTDNRGPAAVNRELSKERVLSVVRYMVSKGISADRIKPFGWGESRPLYANATPEGRAQNRRIEINVLEGML